MIVNSLITSVQKYFSTLSVGSTRIGISDGGITFGDSKVTLIRADEDKRPMITNEAGQTLSASTLELDATESITTNISNTTMKHQAESHQTYVDGIVRNANRMTIVAYIDQTKLAVLRELSNPNIWMYILHTKSMGGTVDSTEYDADATLYHLSTVNIVDDGYKNTVKVQLEMEEVRLYKHEATYKFGVEQTNSISGDSTSKVAGDKTARSWSTVVDDKIQGWADKVTGLFGGGQ